VSIILWDDNPSEIDFLGFDAVVVPVMQAIQAPELDPVTIGIHAPWGGGKSTVLGLIADALGTEGRYLVIRTDPWEYDDQTDVKGTVIAEVLGALEERFGNEAGLKDKTKALLKRISWSRVGIALANGALTMQWDADKLIDAFTPRTKETPDSMTGFRSEFASLLGGLDIERVVVLVDDLDRCLPGAVTATLEAIKLRRDARVIRARPD
jgi:predicted KAP-like P-loop ATPase